MNSMFLELLRNCSNEAITLKKTYLKNDWLPYKLSEGSQKHSRNTFSFFYFQSNPFFPCRWDPHLRSIELRRAGQPKRTQPVP